MLKFKYEFLQQGLHRISMAPGQHEKLYLELVRIVTDELQKQLYPRLWERVLHQAKVVLIERPAYRKAFVREK